MFKIYKRSSDHRQPNLKLVSRLVSKEPLSVTFNESMMSRNKV